MTDEQRKLRHREAARRYRERQKAAGIKSYEPTEERKARNAAHQAAYRARLRAAGRDPAPWWKNNRERHAINVRAWREQNVERARELGNISSKKLQASPWGRINKRIWDPLRRGVASGRQNNDLLSEVLGYKWDQLRAHLEAQFTTDMTWENWRVYWQIDHIEPLARFKYEDILDPLVRYAWRLDNLRPLPKHLNQSKGSRFEPST